MWNITCFNTSVEEWGGLSKKTIQFKGYTERENLDMKPIGQKPGMWKRLKRRSMDKTNSGEIP